MRKDNIIKCLIVEDEQLSAKLLQTQLEQIEKYTFVIDMASSVKEAKEKIDNSDFEIVFLDINLDGESGFEVIDSYSIRKRRFNIIFTTAHSEFSIPAFKYSAVDYLLKPIEKSQLVRAVDESKERINLHDHYALLKIQLNGLSNDALAIPTMGCIEVVKFEKIFYCKADSSYTQIVSQDGNFLASKTLKSIEEMVQPFGFHRIHASYLVNMAYLKRYIKGVGGQVLLENGDLLPVSIRRKDGFLNRLKKID